MENMLVINYIKSLSDNEKIQEILINILGKIILKEQDFDLFIIENENKLIHIRDWVAFVVDNNEILKTPRVINIETLNKAADKYFQKKNNKLQTIELDETQEKLIADLGDYYIVQMLTPEALDNESKVMQHCIGYGGYDKKLLDNNYQYLSLRDKFNKAHVTLEIENNKVLQLQGKQNKIPEQKYLEIIFPWLVDKGYKGISWNQIGKIYHNGQWFDFNEIPDNFTINGDLYFTKFQIEKLPNNLIINGNLTLRNSKLLKELPKGLVVNGILTLDTININNLPDDIKINKSFNLICCHKLKKLPDKLFVNGNLFIYNCPNLKKIPNNLVVNGDLSLSHLNIKEIPDDIKIKGIIDIRNTKIKNVISVDKNFCDGDKEYTKHEFFEKYKLSL